MEKLSRVEQALEQIALSPRLTYTKIAEQGLLGELCGIHEIAQLRKLMRERGSEVLEESGTWEREYGPTSETFQMCGKFAIGSHCQTPDVRYLWTSEFIGYAPKGHPAEGQLILAKVEGMAGEETIKSHGVLDMVFGRDRGIIISPDHYSVCEEYEECRKFNRGDYFLDAWIIGFEDRSGLMVPVLGKVEKRKIPNPDWRKPGDAEILDHTYLPQHDPEGYGSLLVPLNNLQRPICFRPASWMPGTGFNSTTSVDCAFYAVEKGKILPIISEKTEN